MPKLYSPHFKPGRGGHAPGYLRDAFLEALEARSGQHNPTVDAGSAGVTLRQLCGVLWNCTDIMPRSACDELDMQPGSTYAMAARMLRAG